MDFDRRVWNICKKIPEGRVSTYKEMAEALGTKAFRAVGNALNRNPYGAGKASGDRMVPCHRVINSDGRVGGFASGTGKKAWLLEKEGIEIKDGKVDLRKFLFRF